MQIGTKDALTSTQTHAVTRQPVKPKQNTHIDRSKHSIEASFVDTKQIAFWQRFSPTFAFGFALDRFIQKSWSFLQRKRS